MEKIDKDDLLSLSAALSYYTALSLAPFLILLITFLSALGPSLQAELMGQVRSLLGEPAASGIQMILENAKDRPNIRTAAGLFGVFTLLFSAGAIFGQMRDSLDRIFEVSREERKLKEKVTWLTSTWTYLRVKLLNMGMVLTFVFISIVSLLISSVVSIYLTGQSELLGQILNFVISIVIFTLLFTGIYFFLPSRKGSLKVATLSGLLTAIFFSAGKTLIGLYLGKSAVGSAYGAAGSMIVLLVWVYYSSAIIFLSAELAHQLNIRWRFIESRRSRQ